MANSAIRVTLRSSMQKIEIPLSRILGVKASEQGTAIYVRRGGAGADESAAIVSMAAESEAEVQRLLDEARAAGG